ncbi:exonuclease domain-containing protein [Kineococcus sp. SYSU DK006]|uniref:exonuclease domain-containing protein n=1 Tax=Kineococcus sp. SYSU DK006 TaxID=3383127 RepID=UPI003D7D1122
MTVESTALRAAVAQRYPHRYTVLDVETTGFSPQRGDRVVQVALTQLDASGAVEATWSTLVDPERDPGPVHVHGITTARLRGAPRFAEIAPVVAEHLAGRVLVAHNAAFDWGFLSVEMQRAGHPFDVEHRLCTLALARRLDLPVPDYKLASLAAHWEVEQLRAHDAEDDTRVLVEVLRHQLRTAADYDLDLPLTRCVPERWDPAARPVPRPVPSWPASAPRVECPWRLPQPWVPGAPLVQGARVVLTGDTRASRLDLMHRAIAAGLDVKNGVNRTTALLVCNDPTLASRKARDAVALEVPVVDEDVFEALLAAVAPGVPKSAPVPATRPPAAAGPFARRRVLVLGGTHEQAAAARAEVVARGGAAAVNLTMTTTDVVALPGAERDSRWRRTRELRLPLLDPRTWERPADLIGDGLDAAGSSVAERPEPAVLPRGGAVDLPPEQRQWVLDVQWAFGSAAVDVVALRLDEGSRATGDEDLVFWNAPVAPDRSVRVDVSVTGESEVALDLDRLPPAVDRVAVAAALTAGVTFGDVGAVELRLRSGDGAVLVQSTLDAATVEQVLVLGEFYRRGEGWRFRARGQGHAFGLAGWLTGHGLTVEG